MTITNKNKGLTIITLTYQRMTGLKTLMGSILAQNLNDLEVEFILCNNWHKKILKPSLWSAIGRRIKKFKDIKIFNTSNNYQCQIRYQLATLAKHETVLFLDDDVILLDKNFVYEMYVAFHKLEKNDILSAHGLLWTEYHDDSFKQIVLNYKVPEITEITECDAVGCGVSMFNKHITMHPSVLNLTPEFPQAYDMGFPLVVTKEFGSRKYYFPAYKKLTFHKQKTKNPLSQGKDYYNIKHSLYKFFWLNGYQPVLSRIINISESPEIKAKNLLIAKQETHNWQTK